MGVCISGRRGDFAPIVLLTQDDDDTLLIAQEYLTDTKTVHSIRNMRGITGNYRGLSVSVQGLGVGGVSASMYVEELAREFSPKYLIKLDGCIAIKADICLGDLIFAQTAHTTSKINRYQYGGKVFPAAANFGILNHYYERALNEKKQVHVGSVISLDTREEMPLAFEFGKHGALCLDLELNQILTVASLHGISAVGLLSVFSNVTTSDKLSSTEMRNHYLELVRFTLDGLHALP